MLLPWTVARVLRAAAVVRFRAVTPIPMRFHATASNFFELTDPVASRGKQSLTLHMGTPSVADARSPEQLDRTLAFVNRYAETLDVLFPNLINQEALRTKDKDAKLKTPLAAQPPGTGKTALGRNIISVLQRPREDATLQVDVARRLLNAWAWRGATHSAHSLIAAAIADERDENLVMRTLRVCFPHHVDALERLKASSPIVVPIKALPRPGRLLDFDDALGYLIYASASGHKDPSKYVRYVETGERLRGSDGVVEVLIQERGPLLLVLDDITDLQRSEFSAYFASEDKPTALHRAMTQLSQTLQRLQGIPGCFVFCTGRSLWLSAQALVGATSPLFVTPLLLAPLTVSDVLETLRQTRVGSTSTLLENEVGVAPAMLPYLAEQAVLATGGMGRPLQFLLRALQRESSERSPAAAPVDVDAALERARSMLSEVPGLVLRISWDGPAAAEGDVPVWLQQEMCQRRLLRLFAHALLLDAPFVPSLDIVLGPDTHVKFSDAAVVLGLNYAPFSFPPLLSDNNESVDNGGVFTAGTAQPPTHVRLVAGNWLCRSLTTDPRILSHPNVLATSMFLDTMRTIGGTMRGRPFELLCIDALCARSLMQPDVPLRQLVAHLGVSTLRNVRMPRLALVAIPKVTSGSPRLDDDARAVLMRDRSRWPGDRSTLNTLDLPWLLLTWLRPGTIAVPYDALGGAQDWFVRLGDYDSILGVANKAVSEKNGTQWADLKLELAKVPELPAPHTYTLVLWSLNLAPELRDAVGTAETCVFSSGPWYLQGGHLTQKQPASRLPKVMADKPVCCVPERVELIVVNPHATSGGGLADLLGSDVLVSLHEMAKDELAKPLDVPSLMAWIK